MTPDDATFSEDADHPTGARSASPHAPGPPRPSPVAKGTPSSGESGADDALDAPPAACANCGTAVDGAYCSSCGQRVRSHVRPLWQLGSELLEDLLELDLRTVRTIPALLLRPGHLTRAYVDGRRRRYVRPLRLYLFASFLLFTLLSLQGGGLGLTLNFNTDDNAVYVGSAFKVEGTNDSTAAASGSDAVPNDAAPAPSESGAYEDVWTAFKWEASFPDSTQGRDMGERFRENALRAAETPGTFIRTVVERMPVMMFLLLPVFALLLKLAYVRTERLYVEHLIFSLHVHAFAFLAFSLSAVFGIWRGEAADAVALVVRAAPLVYFYVALHRVYEQSLLTSLVKATLLLLVYAILYNVAVALLTALTLLFL